MFNTSTIAAVVVVLALSVTSVASAQEAKPSPELKKFDIAIGTWQFEGEMKAAGGTAGTMAGTETFEWLPGGYFMKMTRDAKASFGDFKTLVVYRYDLLTKAYVATLFHTGGVFETATIAIDGNVWKWAGTGYLGNGTPMHERCTLTFAPDGRSMTLACDVSTDAKSWAPELAAKYTKVK